MCLLLLVVVHLATQTHDTTPGPWLEDWILSKTEWQRATNKYPGLTQASVISLARWDFATLKMMARTILLLSPKRDQGEKGQSWDRKWGSRSWKDILAGIEKEVDGWIKRPAIAASWKNPLPSLAAAVIPQTLTFTFQCSVLGRTGSVAPIHLLPQTAACVAHI